MAPAGKDTLNVIVLKALIYYWVVSIHRVRMLLGGVVTISYPFKS